jgi:transposase
MDHVPGNRWETYTIIAGLRSTGIIAPMVIAGAMNTEALRVWVSEVLAPRLRRGDIVVWDNLSIHRDPDVAALIRARGAKLRFLPPYSPEFNPIEEAWSKLKAILRVASARTIAALVVAIGDAFRAISRRDCRGWFTHAGYVLP